MIKQDPLVKDGIKQIAVSKASKEELVFDQTLRPKVLSEFIGQENIKRNLKIFMEAAKRRGEPLEHVLLYGPPGLGKTTLANIIAREMGVNIKITSGPAIEKTGDLAAILTNLKEGDVLFIDEIHRLKMPAEEILYSAMEDYALDIIIGKGAGAKSMRLNLPSYTLIGATTKPGIMSSPLRDRFGNVFKLNFYEVKEIEEILGRSSKILECKIENEAVKEIAKSARCTPRIANRLLKRLRDIAEVNHKGIITQEISIQGLKSLGVDEIGLDHTDREIMESIIKKFDGGPVGLSTIAAATSEEEETIEDIYEPYLMKVGFLKRTPRGRVATKNAYLHLNLKYDKKEEQSMMF